MKIYRHVTAFALAIALAATLFFPPAPARAGAKQSQQEATAAALGEAYLLYNYGRKQNSKNGAYAIAGAAGTAYLWNKYGQQRSAEKKQEQAKLDYYRRRSAYYHKMALRSRSSSRYAQRR